MTELEHYQHSIISEYLIENFKADGSIGRGVAFAVVGDHENRPSDMTNIVVLNDQKVGAAMNISHDVIGTLRAEANGHPPVICIQGGGTTSQRANGSGWSEDISYTLNALDVHGVAYEIQSIENRASTGLQLGAGK